MNLNLRCPISPETSYGLVSTNFLKHLTKLGVNVALFPIGPVNADNQEDASFINQGMQNAQTFDYDAPTLTIYHQFALAERVGRGILYGFPIFELDDFNALELHHLRGCDRIIVCSEWAKTIINNCVTKKYLADVVPLGIDTNIFFPPPSSKTHKCIFLNCGKTEIRKGADILCDLFNEAFTPEDKVELQWANHNWWLTPEENKDWNDSYLNSKMGKVGKIKIIPRITNQDGLNVLYQNATCGIFPTRAEGWCLPGLEMLACNKPIIITIYSGQTEFLKSGVCYPVMPDGKETAYDGKWFKSGFGEWARLGQKARSEFIRHMRSVYDDWKKNDGIVNNLEGLYRAREFSWENSAKKLREVIFGAN